MSTLPFRRNTIVDSVFEELKKRIISGEYKAGFQLRQDLLAGEMGTSRIPVREALVKLESEGLIEIIPHKGGVVRRLSLEEATELFDLRILIECDLLKKSLPHMRPEDFDEAEIALAKFDKVVVSLDNIDHWTRLNWEYHYQFYKAAKRPYTIKTLQTLHGNTDRYIRQQLLKEGAPERAHEEHAALLELGRKGKVEAAANLLRRHIENAFEQVKAELGQNNS
ncbi:GntR family transcriptional regulator [Luteithermobacter gelatinilyticus]|uniref:GntR family transcriptional regulator n=1 Tax=Luteithermobacter gelatinilyticus TaxID=2582913 RepID=UPI001AEF6637|nr:GntR family transcriptional regulator [Luteithermobacter gelatinilyticus]